MVVRLGQLIAFAAVVGGCSFDRGYDDSRLLCAADGRCPDGFRCDESSDPARCVRDPGADASPPTSDAARPDATPAPDASQLTVCERADLAPDNDLCGQAIDITVDITSIGGAIFYGDTTAYQNTINPAVILNCTNWPEPGSDAIYRFDAPAGSTLEVTLATDGGWDGAIYLLDGCSSSATCLGGDDKVGFGLIDDDSIPIATAGTYYLIVDANHVASYGCYTLTAALL
jgi:hypothetical protein